MEKVTAKANPIGVYRHVLLGKPEVVSNFSIPFSLIFVLVDVPHNILGSKRVLALERQD